MVYLLFDLTPRTIHGQDAWLLVELFAQIKNAWHA